MCIGGGDPKDTNHTPQRAMSFTSFGQFALQPRQRVPSQSPNLLRRFLGPENPLTFNYLKQFHSGEYRMGEDETWFKHEHAHYNELGNEIKFMHVYGNSSHNVIKMRMRTHDYIEGGDGRNLIEAGWGNDVIISGNQSAPWERDDIGYRNSRIFGENGHDTLIMHGKVSGYGGPENDTLIAYNGSSWDKRNYMNGGVGDDTLIAWGRNSMTGNLGYDTFIVNAETARGGRATVVDFDSDDKLIINFKTEGDVFGGIAGMDDPHREGEFMSYIRDTTGAVVAEVRCLLDDFDIDVTNGGTKVTITGQDFANFAHLV